MLILTIYRDFKAILKQIIFIHIILFIFLFLSCSSVYHIDGINYGRDINGRGSIKDEQKNDVLQFFLYYKEKDTLKDIVNRFYFKGETIVAECKMRGRANPKTEFSAFYIPGKFSSLKQIDKELKKGIFPARKFEMDRIMDFTNKKIAFSLVADILEKQYKQELNEKISKSIKLLSEKKYVLYFFLIDGQIAGSIIIPYILRLKKKTYYIEGY